MNKTLLPCLLLSALTLPAVAETWSFRNITRQTFENECFRLPVRAPEGACRVTQDGAEIPCVVDSVDNRRYLWVRTPGLQPGSNHVFEVASAQPAAVEPCVRVEQTDTHITIENGMFAIRVPAAQQGSEIPPPVLAVKLGGNWVGKGSWDTRMSLGSFQAEVIDDGRVFGKVRLRYEFDGMAGNEGDVPAYAEVDVTLKPGVDFAVIEERHEMDRTSAWEFEATAGWKATGSAVIPHSGGMGGSHRWKEKRGTLKLGQCGNQDPALIVNLFPRWNQHSKDGWVGAAVDDELGLGAIVTLAGYWYWPHDNAIACLATDSEDTMIMRCPTRRGMRYWMLVAGSSKLFHHGNARWRAARHGLDALDTIVRWVKIREWPGMKGGYSGYWPLGDHINPTGGIRGRARGAIANAGKLVDNISHLTKAQVMNSPHTYGSYWLYWSPENPNFFTDFNKIPIGMLCNLRNHPRFDELAQMALRKFREDMYHSIVMPSGAGNECPGYQQYAMHHYLEIAKVCKQYLGEDATRWPRFKAGARYMVHLSQPTAPFRRGTHPGGDTHGGYVLRDPRRFAEEFGVEVDLKELVSEELQGFGVVLRNACGTPDETYFAFKSGPSRGHYHGDQLSFHYCAYGHPIAVDHHCSYSPRAGQEHMHNRVAFHTDEIPYANMDGYERVIAFKPSDFVDVTMGQVESWRLRGVRELPPEAWHQMWPLIEFEEEPLVYRRTVVHVRDGKRSFFVLRDQSRAPVDLKATYCLHVRGDTCEREGRTVAWDGLTAFVAHPADFTYTNLNFSHSNGEPESTIGLRATVTGKEHEFVTALFPHEPKRGDVAELTFHDALVRADGRHSAVTADVSVVLCWIDGRLVEDAVRVKAPDFNGARHTGTAEDGLTKDAYKGVIKLEMGSRRRIKGGPLQVSVSCRIEGQACRGSYNGTFQEKPIRGKVSGRFLRDTSTPVPMYRPADPAFEALPDGVRVGDVTVRFAGGIDEDAGTDYVTVKRGDKTLAVLNGKDVDLDRSQGSGGLFVPDAGYPFGEIPEWLIRQRNTVPEWAPGWAREVRSRQQ